jgi:hypothetical protein
LGIDPKSLSRDQKNLFMEDLLTEKELNDILGKDKSVRDSKSFAEAARSGVYDDKGYEKYDSPTTPSTVGGGTIDASGNVAVGNVVSSVTDDKLSQAAKNIAAGNSDISVGNISITGVTEKGEVNVDINGDGKADRAVDSKGNSRNFNIDNESSGGDSNTSDTDSGGIGGVDASGDTDPGDGPSGDASAGADASGSPGTDNDTADADSEDSGVGSGGAGVGG